MARIIELDEAVSRIKQACEDEQRPPFFFMVGAGISLPSVPIATDVISQCKEESQKRGRNNEPSPKDQKETLDVYSHWFQTAYPEPDQRQKYLRQLIEGKPITHSNFRLAHLLLNNTISNIVVTTNFDDFLSKALTLFGKPHIVCDHPRTVGRINPARSIVQIIHLHGTYWFYDCCNLRGELEDRAQQSTQTTSTMSSLLDMILWDRSPLVTGYSGWEGDVFMASLRRRLERPLGTNVYWFCYLRSQTESMPDWLKNNPNVCFVVPPAKSIEKESLRTTKTDQVSAAPEKIVEQSAAKKEEEPTLPADRVLVKLIQEFSLSAPELTTDPLGFFAQHLERSLPKGDASEADIYAIKSIIERVRRAKERHQDKVAKAIPVSEQTLEKVRDALRRADYREVVRQGEQIPIDNLSPTHLDELFKAMWVAGTGLFDNSNEEISAYDLVIRISDRLLDQPDAERQLISNRVATAFYNKGVMLGELNRSEEAIAAYDEVVKRYGESTEPDLRELVANTSYNKGVSLGDLNRSEEEIAAYDEVVKRYGEATDPSLREWVAKALYNKGVSLGVLKRSEEEIATYDEVVKRYGQATEPVLREQVANALYNKGVSLGDLNRSEEAIAAYDEVLKRYGQATEPSIREWVAKALYNKGVSLGALNRSEEEIAAYDEVVKRYGQTTEPAVREQVANALYGKGFRLGALNRNEEAIATYEEIVKRFGNAMEPALREQVANALYNKGFRLGALNRNEEAIATYDEVVKRYGEATEPAVHEQVAKALYNKGVILGASNRNEEAIAVYDEVVKRYEETTDAALRKYLELALNNKSRIAS